jgi:hypothetical protein
MQMTMSCGVIDELNFHRCALVAASCARFIDTKTPLVICSLLVDNKNKAGSSLRMN